MLERRLLVLQYMGKAPFLGTCERCHFKFFTPRELGRKLVEAEQNMQERFDSHKCKAPRRRRSRYPAARTFSGLCNGEDQATRTEWRGRDQRLTTLNLTVLIVT